MFSRRATPLAGGSQAQGTRFWCGLLALLLLALTLCAAPAGETIPPSPKPYYFKDYAGVVPPDVAQNLNQRLEDFERETSSQIVVVVYPKMLSDSSVEDYTVRVAQAWKVGQQAKDNGAVLFVFIQDRSMYLQVGYGLEGAIPDALAKRIIEDEIKPHFRSGDYAGGLVAGTSAILAAAKGEYRGSGSTFAERGSRASRGSSWIGLLALVVVLILLAIARGAAGGRAYSRRGYRRWGGGGWGGWGGSGWGGGGWGGGGWSGGGGGGGFSGGGGSFGGGGAGGRW